MHAHEIIISWACIGYKMIDSQEGVQLQVGYNHLVSNKHEWNNSTKTNHKNSLNLTELVSLFPLTRICGACYNGPYTMALNQLKTLELHYPMS